MPAWKDAKKKLKEKHSKGKKMWKKKIEKKKMSRMISFIIMAYWINIGSKNQAVIVYWPKNDCIHAEIYNIAMLIWPFFVNFAHYFLACSAANICNLLSATGNCILHGTVGENRKNRWQKHLFSRHLFCNCGGAAIFTTSVDCSTYLWHDLQICTRTTIS